MSEYHPNLDGPAEPIGLAMENAALDRRALPAQAGGELVPPTKEPCRCSTFCLEDTKATGRYCKLKAERAASPPPADGGATKAAAAHHLSTDEQRILKKALLTSSTIVEPAATVSPAQGGWTPESDQVFPFETSKRPASVAAGQPQAGMPEMPPEPAGWSMPIGGGNHMVIFKFDYDHLRQAATRLQGALIIKSARVQELAQVRTRLEGELAEAHTKLNHSREAAVRSAQAVLAAERTVEALRDGQPPRSISRARVREIATLWSIQPMSCEKAIEQALRGLGITVEE